MGKTTVHTRVATILNNVAKNINELSAEDVLAIEEFIFVRFRLQAAMKGESFNKIQKKLIPKERGAKTSPLNDLKDLLTSEAPKNLIETISNLLNNKQWTHPAQFLAGIAFALKNEKYIIEENQSHDTLYNALMKLTDRKDYGTKQTFNKYFQKYKAGEKIKYRQLEHCKWGYDIEEIKKMILTAQ